MTYTTDDIAREVNRCNRQVRTVCRRLFGPQWAYRLDEDQKTRVITYMRRHRRERQIRNNSKINFRKLSRAFKYQYHIL
jgi:hypothetical protein